MFRGWRVFWAFFGTAAAVVVLGLVLMAVCAYQSHERLEELRARYHEIERALPTGSSRSDIVRYLEAENIPYDHDPSATGRQYPQLCCRTLPGGVTRDTALIRAYLLAGPSLELIDVFFFFEQLDRLITTLDIEYAAEGP